MNSDAQSDFPTIRLRPIISYPRHAQAGKSYLMTIDLQLEAPGAPWPFPEEEYAISCILDTQPYFSYEPLEGREPAIVLHRFGGSYGPAQYILTAAPHELPKGAISITFTNPYGIPIAYTELECEISRSPTTLSQSRAVAASSPSTSPKRSPSGSSRLHPMCQSRKTISSVRACAACRRSLPKGWIRSSTRPSPILSARWPRIACAPSSRCLPAAAKPTWP